MIIGIGNDIVDIRRVSDVYSKRGLHFLQSILSAREIELFAAKGGRAEFIAGRWAAKEAFSKALGCGMCEECAFMEIEILNDDRGAPCVTLLAETARTAEKRGVSSIHVSISHEKDYASAMVVLEG